MIGVTAFLFWYAERIADPDWKPSLSRMEYLLAISPFWRGAHIAIIGSWTGAIALLLLWKAARPYTPDPSRRGGVSRG